MAIHRHDNHKSANALMEWVDKRFPATKVWNEHLAEYMAAKNFNFWYFFGSLAILMLVVQIATGIFLTMHYKPDAELAFASVLNVFCCGVFAYVSRRYLRFTSRASRISMVNRLCYLRSAKICLIGAHK